MAKKRRRSTKDDNDEAASDKDVEMEEIDLEDKEKVENKDGLPPKVGVDEEIIPFLDSFYGLSSSDPQERAVSAQAMLYHCLLGPQANTKDATYAMKRLLNGLCSSRASSRQGYSAALASFLKLTFSLGIMKYIQVEKQHEGSILTFVRQQLISATDTSQISGGGKKKASEERDYQLGRLFGILSVVRSGILLPKGKDSEDISENIENAVAFAGLLIDLHRVKSMKEAAANAIVTFLGAFYNLSGNESSKAIVDDVVRNAIIPKVFFTSDGKKDTLPIESYTAEQLAVALYIQSNSEFHPKKLVSPLDKPILSLKTISAISPALSASATTMGQEIKLHQVWASFLSLVTEPVVEESTSEKKRKASPTRRVLKEKIGADDAQALLDSVLQEAILKPMREGKPDDGDKNGRNIQEFKAVALCLAKILCGGEYFDSASGPSFIDLNPSYVESTILCPEIVTMLLDVLSASSGKPTQKKLLQELKPMAAQVLESLVDRAESNTDSLSSRRLAYARALVQCEPRFDARTETSVVSDLLMLGASSSAMIYGSLIPVWTEYISFLMDRILTNAFEESKRSASNASSEIEGGFSHKALGYVDLLVNIGKQAIRMQSNSSAEDKSLIDAFKTNTMQRLLAFFMVSAFFKLSSLKSVGDSTGSAKKAKKQSKGRKSTSGGEDATMEAALLLKAAMSGSQGQVECIPYSVRTILSSRYYSLLAEFVAFSPSNAPNKEPKETRDDRAYGILSSVLDGWQALERHGAERYQAQEDGSDEKNEDRDDPMALVSKLRSLVDGSSSSDDKERAETRWKRGAAVLEMSLSLHLLSCGSRENTASDDADEDAVDDDELEVDEIVGFMSDLDQTTNELLSQPHENDENPLMGLAELSVGILTSPLGSGTPNRGASSKLVREVVKLAWTAGLSLCASSDAHAKRCLLDQDVIALLLESMGASAGRDMEVEAEDGVDGEGDEVEDDDSDDDDDDEGDASEVKVSTTKSAEQTDMDLVVDGEVADEDSDDDDIMLDPSKLSTLLEESDDDMDVEDVLEHHQGADAALAKFIKAKQEARKAGQQARERLEMTNNTRNSVLLEVLVASPGKALDKLLRSDVILSTLLPLLSYRNDLEKSLAKAAEKGKNSSDADKRALADRIGFMLKSKICKMRLANSSIPFSEGVDRTEFVSDLLGQLVKESAKSHSREQLACCSGAWVVTLRSLGDPSEAIQVAQVHCQEAVRIWASQRNSGMTASLLEDLIQQTPSVAKASLAGPLAQVAKTSRNFLKAEAFRLLSLLYGIPSAVPTTAAGAESGNSVGLNQLEESTGDVVDAVLASFDDKDVKAKRRKDVLKTLEKLVAWVAKELAPCSAPLASKLENVGTRLAEMGGTMEIPAMKQQCERLAQDIRDICSNSKSNTVEVVEKGSGKKKKKSLSSKPSDEGSSKKSLSPKPRDEGSSKKSKSPKPSDVGSNLSSKPSDEGSSKKSKYPKPNDDGSNLSSKPSDEGSSKKSKSPKPSDDGSNNKSQSPKQNRGSDKKSKKDKRKVEK